MKQNHQFRVAGVGTAIGAVMIGSFWLACQPGKLPCDKEEFKEVCAETPGGNGGGGGGGGGGSGGSGTDAVPPGLNENTPITCADFPTLGKMDDFFGMRCGVNATCHLMAIPWTDMKSPKVWERLSDPMLKSKAGCVGGKLIDTDTWSNSVLIAKTKTPVVCPPGTTTPGATMPPNNLPPMMAPLSAAEIACLESFVKVIADGK